MLAPPVLRSHHVRLAATCAFALAALAWAMLATAVPITVRGRSSLSLIAHRDAGTIVVRGELHDDVGATLADQIVVLSIRATGGDRAVQLPKATACEGQPLAAPPRRSGNRRSLRVATDERGTFCVRMELSVPRGRLNARFEGDSLYDGVKASTEIRDAADDSIQTIVRFEPQVQRVDLDRESFAVTASLSLDRGTARRSPGARRREGLELSLKDERDEVLATAETSGDGRARFDVATKSLAGPGAGHLTVVFGGTDDRGPSESSHPVLRHAEVSLELEDDIEPGDPDEGIPIAVRVEAAGEPVQGGVVEAVRGTQTVGAGNVVDGHAEVVATFAAGRADTVPLTLRYVSARPWYRAGPTLAVDVPVVGPSLWRQILTGLLVVAIAAWVVARWRRAPKPELEKDETTPPPPSGRPGLSVISSGSGRTDWSGVVADAHEGYPIAAARLTIVVPTFEGDGVVASALADDDGAFSLEGPSRPDARLRVEAPMHAAYEQALPSPSTIRVALVTRRRALVDRLVRWSRKMGAPYDGPPEPTPGHVRRVATRARAHGIADWARSLEHAVFGLADVDEEAERQVRAEEPSGRREKG